MALNEFYGVARQIAETIGEAEARVLLGARGGTYIDLPKRIEGSMLCDLIGEIAACKMVEEFGAGRLELPMGPDQGMAGRRARAMRMLEQGRSVRVVALTCGLTYRTVSGYRAQLLCGDPDREAQLRFPWG